ncbi:hypothetical protein BSKO_04651 [Bryopsis sp. KO-2023]|nr:hypothetical protein BSKO_04651 [Bryopsis sp. KO-2023]
MECGGAQWACPGKCPCTDLKEGVCPPPSQNRTELKCPDEIQCRRDSDCDLNEKCCPEHHAHPKKSCGHFCRPPYIDPQKVCIRTKPWWLGTVQGAVSLGRFFLAARVQEERRTFAYFVNACIELLEMGAIAFDFFVLNSGYLNTILGDNSLLEAIEIMWMLNKLYNKGRPHPDMTGCMNALGWLTCVIYSARLILVSVSIGTFAIGAIWYGIVAGPVFLVAIVATVIFFWISRSGNTRGVRDVFSHQGFFCICAPGFPLALFVAVSFLILEVAGIAGWNHILRQPREDFVDGAQLVGKCNRVLLDSKRCNLTFVKLADYWEGFKYVYTCGSLEHWIRDARDAFVMAIGIL